MPSDRFEFRVSYGKLLFWLLITLVPIAAVGLYSLSHSERALSRMVGTHLASIAESTSAEGSTSRSTAPASARSSSTPRRTTRPPSGRRGASS